MKRSTLGRFSLFSLIVLCTLLAGGATRIVQDQCGPFSDVTPGFCPYVLELYYLGITAGTSPTTFSPDDPLTRGQGAVFIAKGLNQSLARSSRRAALGQWWEPTNFAWSSGLAITPLPDFLGTLVCDGSDVWVGGNASVFRVRASDGRLLDTWSITQPATAMLAAMGRIFIVGASHIPDSGSLYLIDPSALAGAATQVATLPNFAQSLAFDGNALWTANETSVSRIDPSSTMPWTVTTLTAGFQFPTGIVFDGQSVWVTDAGSCSLFRLDASGTIQQTVSLGTQGCSTPPIFDGNNVLVPTVDGLQVVHASDGSIVATIPIPFRADRMAFDGERLLVASMGGNPSGITILRAADFSTLRTEIFPPFGSQLISGVASDGVNFWITLTLEQPDWVLGRY